MKNMATYLPHKAVAEVSKDKEPIGRECADFNWFESQLMSGSNKLRVKWFGCHLIWDSNDSGCQLIWDSIDLAVNWFEIQLIWASIDLRFKWVGCQLVWDSSDLDVKWFEVQVIWLSTDVWFKWFCHTKLFCETSSKKTFEAQKRSFCARLPKHFCETSSKNEMLKLKNESFLRDFLQNWTFEAQKRNFSARLPPKLKLWSSKTKLFYETSFKNDMSTRHLASEFQYVLTIFKWTLQKYCACHEKVEPRHTKSCNCHAKWSLETNTSVTWNLQPFHGFCVGGFKHRHHKARNHCACHAKRIVSEPLQIHHACQRFCNPHELLRLPRIFQRVEIPAPATRNALSTSKNVPRPSVFNDFDFRIALARRRGANFAKLNFQKCSEHAAWCLFFVKIALARRRGANFAKLNFQKCSEHASVWRFWLPNRSGAQAWCKFCRHLGQPILRTTSLFRPTFASLRSHETSEKHSISRNSYPPKSLLSHICAVKHLCCPTSMMRDLPATFSIVGS